MGKEWHARYAGWEASLHGTSDIKGEYDHWQPASIEHARMERDEMRRARKAARQTGVTPPKPAITPRASGRTV